MKVMISQPMNGRKDEDIKKEREIVINKLKKMHIDVLDTFFEDEVLGVDRADIYLLSKAIYKMCEADAVLFIGDWQNARGCRVEHLVAKSYNIKCLYEDFLNTDNDDEPVDYKNVHITCIQSNDDHALDATRHMFM